MEQTICIFGASATWGAWDYEKGGWVNRLRLFVDTNTEYTPIYNLGISGDTTKELLTRFEGEAKARRPTIIIFSIGDNDSIFIKSKNKQLVPLQQFEKNLEKLIKHAKEITNVIIFVGCKKVDETKTAPIPWEKDYHYTNQKLAPYNTKIREVTQKNKVYFIDVIDLLQKEDLEDGLHPNSKGHEKIFLKVKDFLLNKKLI